MNNFQVPTDYIGLCRARENIEDHIRRCKMYLRAPWTNEQCDYSRMQENLVVYKGQITILYTLIAHYRGRQHVRDPERHARIIEKYAHTLLDHPGALQAAE